MVRRWVKIGSGVAGGITTLMGFFLLLTLNFGFVITDMTGNFSCEGSYENPCISEFTVKNPTSANVDVYSLDQVKLDFSPGIKDWALFVPDGRCSATGKCACEMENGEKLGFEDWRCVDFTNKTKPRKDKVYNFRFERYSTTTFRLAGIKESPDDRVKWTFGANGEELDPVWDSNPRGRFKQSMSPGTPGLIKEITNDSIIYHYGEDLVEISLKPRVLGQNYTHSGWRNGTNHNLGSCNNVTTNLCPPLKLSDMEQNTFGTGTKQTFEWQFRGVSNKTNLWANTAITDNNFGIEILARANNPLERVQGTQQIKAGGITLDFQDMTQEYLRGNFVKPQAWDLVYEMEDNKLRVKGRLKAGYTLNLGDVIYIDPIVTVKELGSTEVWLNNATAEVNFTHLSISGETPYDTLIGYWPMDIQIPEDPSGAGKTTFDYTTNNLDGAIPASGEPEQFPLHVDGYIGKAYNFDGQDDYIEITESPVLNLTNNFTLSAWANPTSVSGFKFIVKRGENTNSKEQYAMEVSQNDLVFYVGNDTDNGFDQIGTNIVTANEWQHFVCTLNSTDDKTCYRNGVKVGSTPNTVINVGAGFSPIVNLIGNSAKGNNRPFNGTIDEVMIFNSSLTDAQVLDIFNNQSARFSLEGNVTHRQFNATSGNNRVNVSVNTFERLGSNSSGLTNISLSVGSWNITDGYDESTTGGLNANLSLYFHFDEHLNSSVNGLNSTPNGGAGILNNSAPWANSSFFDGVDDFLNVPQNPVINNIWVDGGTISFWMFPRSAGEADAGQWVSKSSFYVIGSNSPQGNSIGAIFRIDFSGSTASWREDGDGVDVPLDQWNHIVLVYNASSVDNDPVFYSNNIRTDLTEITTPVGTVVSESVSLQIMSNAAGSRAMNGSIDEWMMFNRTLSADEVAQLYTIGRANYTFTDLQNLSGPGLNNTFTIDSGDTNFVSTFFLLGDPLEQFYTPNLGGDNAEISWDFWTEGVAPPSSCTYVSGNWDVLASDNCVISANVAIDNGFSFFCTGTGTFTVNSGARITGLDYRFFDSTCRYTAFGASGFFYV